MDISHSLDADFMPVKRSDVEKIQAAVAEAEERLRLPRDESPLPDRVCRALGSFRLQLDAAENERDDDRRAILAVIRSLQEEAHHYFSGSSAEKLRQLVTYYRTVSTETLAGARRFRDDIVVQLRALSLCVDMTGSAHTHAEKAARLRGLSEVIEASVAKLRDMRFDLVDGQWWPDVLRSDYPTHELIRTNRWQQDRIASLEAEVRSLSGEVAPDDGDRGDAPLPELPF